MAATAWCASRTRAALADAMDQLWADRDRARAMGEEGWPLPRAWAELGARGAMPARLNLFSPLPPLRSEIGNHTLIVAAALSEMAEVTLWTPQAEPPEVPAGIPVVRYDPAAMDWSRLNQADANVYNIGNNATYHRAIFDIARQAPGIVVLHDTRLQHFFARYSETPGDDRAFYLDSMRRTHGPRPWPTRNAGWRARRHSTRWWSATR